ncbi:DUF1576 domain-containing protein [Jeotgalibaca sp. A127]|uniref:DUF1576 domain-containing protein n=1 Tax=Jeotgalibaca sp. A127 TaxID=3457324 RepID=UPI003FD31611
MTVIPLNTASNFQPLPTKVLYRLFVGISFAMILLAFTFNTPWEIWDGFWLITRSPANLLTDYMALANPGATLINAAVMTLQALGVVWLCRAKITGPVISALFLIIGFSFFGKNFYNSMPIVLGALGYAKITHNPLERSLLAALFGTALGPLVSELTFNQGLSLPVGLVVGISAGFIAGFILPPLGHHVINFTKGFSLYNVGFTCGFVGTIFISIMRSFGMEIEAVTIISTEYTVAFSTILLGFFGIMGLYGFVINRFTLAGLSRIYKHTGQLSTDFIDIGGIGATIINMGLLGIFSTLFILLLGGDLSGPVIGGIMTIVGFGSFGKHLLNIAPIMIGTTLMSYITEHLTQDPSILIAILFSTTLAPIAGRYGTVVGILAGAIHLTLVVNVGFLHGGVNLYNNGFAGGLVAGMMVPILDAIHAHRAARFNPQSAEVDPAEEIETLD